MAAEIFAKIGTIAGESAHKDHRGEIDVLSFSWSVVNTGTIAAGAGAGKPVFHDLSFTHAIDKASPELLKACATGVHIPVATITQRKSGEGQKDYLIIKMTDVIVTGVSLGDASAGSTENVSLAFAKVDFEYKPQKPDGSLDTGIHFKYDIKANHVI